MPRSLCISVCLLDSAFHGRRDGGEAEWPPSPLRLFQALVAAAARRWPNGEFTDRARSALEWFEQQPPPTVVTPSSETGTPYRLSVPNNAMDIVARAWVRGNLSGEGDANPATHKAMKTVRPTRVAGGDTLYYFWKLPESAPDDLLGHVETLTIASRSLVALGWGIDLVVGSAKVISSAEADALPGEQWLPTGESRSGMLRVPRQGTLKALVERHAAFLNRLPASGGFNPVPPLSVFGTVGYRRSIDPPARPFAAFQLLKPDASNMRAFNPARDTRRLVGMMRDAVRRAATAAGWSPEKVAAFVMGHGEARGEQHSPVQAGRFAYLPIPSLEGRGQGKSRVVGASRRMLISSFADGCEAEIAWARRALSGVELVDETTKEPIAILSLIPDSERVLQPYVSKQAATIWTTVTPMVLPGFDDKHSSKADELIRKAIRQAGLPGTLAKHAAIEWRKIGFLPGADLAMRYRVPEYLRNYPRFHIRIQWRDANNSPVGVRGPICLGGGRFLGLGLFAAVGE